MYPYIYLYECIKDYLYQRMQVFIKKNYHVVSIYLNENQKEFSKSLKKYFKHDVLHITFGMQHTSKVIN